MPGTGDHDGAKRPITMRGMRNKRHGSHQVVSVNIIAGWKTANDPRFGNRRGRTMLVVAVDDEADSHLSLQLALDEAAPAQQFHAGSVMVRHKGSLTAGKHGALRRSLVLQEVARQAPDLVRGEFVHLGRLPTNRLIEWSDASALVVNLIRYALVRDSIRQAYRQMA
jgi:hypothetical protein